MSVATTIPGLYYSFVRPPSESSPLRTDVAGFLGRTLRGPTSSDEVRDPNHLAPKPPTHPIAIRVEGWRACERLFGGLVKDAMTPYALRGYFDNGGQVAHVIRLLGQDPNTQEAAKVASGSWQVGTFTSGKLNPDWPGAGHFQAIGYSFAANTPGDWANDTTITVRYWAAGASGKPEVELEIIPPDEPPELLSAIAPENIAEEVNNRSAYVQLIPNDLPAGLLPAQLNAPPGPRYLEWPAFKLTGGTSFAPSKQDYLDAVQVLGDKPEVALVACPDLYPDLAQHYSDLTQSAQKDALAQDQTDVLSTLLIQAEQLHDRLVIIDVPSEQADPIDAVQWVEQRLRESPDLRDEKRLRNGAVYHPRLLVPDPLGGVSAPLRCVPCSGLVAGVISRLDDQQGAYFTPANAEIDEAVDLSRTLKANEQLLLYNDGINLLKCSPSRGMLVWGGREMGQRLANAE